MYVFCLVGVKTLTLTQMESVSDKCMVIQSERD